MSDVRPPEVAFYCVSGADFFLGAVALVNSLRLVGHRDPVYVLDCGLEGWQRELLAAEATIVARAHDSHPSLQKLEAPARHPAEVAVIVDADIVVTRPLTGLIDSAREGTLVAFENESERHFESWGELLGLGAVPRGAYLSSAFFCLGGDARERVLEPARRRLERLDPAATWLAGGDPRSPLFFADQDVVNAVARARLGPRRIVALPARGSAIPPFAGLRVVDAERLRCAYADGFEPWMLHHYFRKPWLVRARTNPYSRLLRRLLHGPGLALAVEPGRLPHRLRPGARGILARVAVDAVVGIPAGLRRRLRRRPEPIEAWPERL